MALTDNLVAYWKLDEASGQAIDVVGNNELTLGNGAIGTTTGKIEGARDFEADSGLYFYCDDNDDLSVTSDQSFSIGGWMNAESSGYRCMVIKASSWPNNAEYAIYTYEGSIYGLIGNGSTYGNPTGIAFNTATWYHVFLTYDAGTDTISLYVNGSANTASLSGGGTSTSAFYMGGDITGSGSAMSYWDGLLDEWGLWKRCLSSGEVSQLYASGSGLAYPFSGGANSFSYTATGGLSLAGSSPQLRAAARVGSGGVLLSGVSGVNKLRTLSAAGGLEFGGTSPQALGATRTASGGVTLAGAATAARARAAAGSGGLLLAGSAALNRLRTKAGTGGVVFSGSSPVTTSGLQTRTVNPSGGLTFGGTAVKAMRRTLAAAGGLVFDGTATVVRVASRAVSGGIQFAGAALKSAHESVRTVVASGGLQLRGSALFDYVGGVARGDWLQRIRRRKRR